MKARAIQMSEAARRNSWLPADFIYTTGERVQLKRGDTLEPAVVVSQIGNTVHVSTVEHVPGSRTEFCCSTPEPVSIFDIALRKTK